MKSTVIISLAIALIPELVAAQPAQGIPEPQFIRRTRAQNDLGFGLGFFVGAGDYPILSMPLMANTGSRVDGSQFQDDVRNNRGSSLGLNLTWRSKKFAYPLSIAGHWLRVATAPGTGIATPASYSRISLDLGSSLGTGLWWLTIEPSAEARRSMYLNVDSGHYIDSINLKTKLVTKLRDDVALSAFYSFAPWTKFGLLQGSDTGASGALSGATTRVDEAGASLNWSVAGQTDLILALVNEISIVRMDSQSGYLSYGLPVTGDPKFNGPKTYKLSMRNFVIGAQKQF